ncbi:hypothetical protein C8Q74DRAFT_253044 [Fomes fomentarius]|nr:hypothetical protein C8Q74DRAFT_253044 [Fomes fomentarius]
MTASVCAISLPYHTGKILPERNNMNTHLGGSSSRGAAEAHSPNRDIDTGTRRMTIPLHRHVAYISVNIAVKHRRDMSNVDAVNVANLPPRCPVARHNRAVPEGLCLLGRRMAVPTPEPPHSSELIFPLDGHPCTRLLFWMHGISLFPWHMQSEIFISSPLGSRFRTLSLRRLDRFYSESSLHSALKLRAVVPVLVFIRSKIAESFL